MPVCDRDGNPAAVVIYPGKKGCVLLCHECFGRHWEYFDAANSKGSWFLVVPLTLPGVHQVFTGLYHSLEDAFTEYRVRSWYEEHARHSGENVA